MPATFTYRERDLTPPDPGAFPEVDEVEGIVRGVKVVGLQSRDGSRIYPPDLLARCALKFEGKPVNIDHTPVQEGGVRYTPLANRFGWLENVRPGPNGLYADLRFNPEHERAAEVLWWVQKNPRGCGLSQDAIVRWDRRPGQGPRTAQDILIVHSVDLVADPNTTDGIQEATPVDESPMPAPTTGGDSQGLIGQLTAAVMADEALDDGKRKKALDLLHKLTSLMRGEAAPAPEATDTAEPDGDEETEGTNLAGVLAELRAMRSDISAVREATGLPKVAPRSVAREPADQKAKPAPLAPAEELFAAARVKGSW